MQTPRRRLRIAWFSPLPPQRTGIADNVVPVLAALREHHDVTLWANARDGDLDSLGLPLERYGLPEVEDHNWDDPLWWEVNWRALNASDAIVYHIGNNAAFHADLWRISAVQPGIVVLHDEALLHLMTAVLPGRCGPAGRERYQKVMGRIHGRGGAEAARTILLDYGRIVAFANECPLTPLVLGRARAVVAHSPDLARRLAEEHECPVAYLPLPFPASQPSPKSAKNKTRSKRGRATIVMMGHMGPNRCLPQVLEALADKRLDRFDLRVFGDLVDGQTLRDRITELGLTDRVRLFGYLPEDELRRRLRDADIAINLRNPTMGEASASQLSLWDAGLPVITSRIGWYATLPEDATAFVDPGNEVDGTREHLLSYLEDPDRFGAMGAAGRRHLEDEHQPASYATGLLDLMAHCLQERTGRFALPWMMERIAEATPFIGRSHAAQFGGAAEATAALLGRTSRPWDDAS